MCVEDFLDEKLSGNSAWQNGETDLTNQRGDQIQFGLFDVQNDNFFCELTCRSIEV